MQIDWPCYSFINVGIKAQDRIEHDKHLTSQLYCLSNTCLLQISHPLGSVSLASSSFSIAFQAEIARSKTSSQKAKSELLPRNICYCRGSRNVFNGAWREACADNGYFYAFHWVARKEALYWCRFSLAWLHLIRSVLCPSSGSMNEDWQMTISKSQIRKELRSLVIPKSLRQAGIMTWSSRAHYKATQIPSALIQYWRLLTRVTTALFSK